MVFLNQVANTCIAWLITIPDLVSGICRSTFEQSQQNIVQSQKRKQAFINACMGIISAVIIIHIPPVNIIKDFGAGVIADVASPISRETGMWKENACTTGIELQNKQRVNEYTSLLYSSLKDFKQSLRDDLPFVSVEIDEEQMVRNLRVCLVFQYPKNITSNHKDLLEQKIRAYMDDIDNRIIPRFNIVGFSKIFEGVSQPVMSNPTILDYTNNQHTRDIISRLFSTVIALIGGIIGFSRLVK
jgi:hypothetical protein